jgi:hypothetical protein
MVNYHVNHVFHRVWSACSLRQSRKEDLNLVRPYIALLARKDVFKYSYMEYK